MSELLQVSGHYDHKSNYVQWSEPRFVLDHDGVLTDATHALVGIKDYTNQYREPLTMFLLDVTKVGS